MNEQCEAFVAAVREAVKDPRPSVAVKALLQEACQQPAGFVAALTEEEATENLLYEDDSCSVWVCRFSHRQVIPAHGHEMTVHLVVLEGTEQNLLFQQQDEGLLLSEIKTLTPGEILSLGPKGIHSVVAAGDQPCVSLHVYFGPLSKVSRQLYDWKDGAGEEVSDDRFVSLTRPKDDLNIEKGLFLTDLPRA
ncbi:hypothetical protein ACTL6U_12335 [Rhodovibrionaceae bacterium A322]